MSSSAMRTGTTARWIERLVERLEPALKQRLGFKPGIWIDDDALRASRDFSKEIPDSVKESAVFLLLPSPSYIRSSYCVEQECRIFEGTIAARRGRFGRQLRQRSVRVPLPDPADGRQRALDALPGPHRHRLLRRAGHARLGTPQFETQFRRLVGELVGLLKRMRNQSTAVFLYPPNPAPTCRPPTRRSRRSWRLTAIASCRTGP